MRGARLPRAFCGTPKGVPDSYSLIAEAKALLAAEEGTLYRDAPLKVALAYPSPYSVGMSSLGFQTMYREVNGHPGASGERVFLPADLAAFRRTRTPLFTWESQSPVSSFAMIAFSMAYELELTGLFAMLELAGLPLLREERGPGQPLVVAGGPLTFSNPAPLEPFVDVLVLGEGEERVHELLDLSGSTPRQELLDRLSRRPGFRVPGRSEAPPVLARAPDDRLPAFSQILTPNTELRSMFLVEPERGCSRGCHYCVMRRTTNGGMRTVPTERILSLIPGHARRVGLVGAAVTDHPEVLGLVTRLVESGRQVGVSSLRADRLTLELVRALRQGGAEVLTIAADGASEKMRERVDRRHTEEQILAAAELAREAGFARLKVYNLVGLPFEEESDLDECVRLTVELSRKLPVVLGVAPFVAKRNTPLDGAPFAGIRETEEKLAHLRRGLRGRAEVRATSARWAWVEYMLAQSGPEAGLAAMDAWRAGGSFAAFRRAFAEREVHPFVERRLPDERRNAIVWPVVSRPPGEAPR